MKHERYFVRRTPSHEVLQTRMLIADIDRVVRILDSDIAAEEQQAGVFDHRQAQYPMLARTLTTRRNNLQDTIAALEKRVSDLLREPARAC
jgi:hypothetical protein